VSAVTKPGRYGTLYLYIIRYTDKHDYACPIFESRMWAYNLEHVSDRFDDSDDDGWKILTIERARDDGLRHRSIKYEVQS